ncbi:MAG: hypothetical protein HY545_02590, partial [Candidatus Doudnabacteria bacterium]|nr:hypothetical protein [Candidatus Doudnabacteria bacterium]
AQNLTVEAANALLKIFEEPRPKTIIILITESPQRLLPTIRSRAQKITFGLVVPDDYAKLLEQKIDKAKGQLIRSLALGRPGMVLRILNADDEEVERLKQILDYFEVLTKGDLVEKMKMAYEVADLETPQIREILDAWISLVDTDKADNLIKARGMIERNVNSKLLLSDLILKFTA